MKPSVTFVMLFLVLLLFSAPAAFPAQDTLFTTELRKLEATYGGHLGMMAKNLRTGETVAYNASDRFPTASVIKLPVLAAFYHLVDQKQVDPNMRVILTKEDKKEGSGILQYMSDGTAITLLDAVKLMIILSDNSATNLVLDRLAPTHEARMKLVNDFLLSKGLKNTRILNRLYSWETKLQTPEAIRYGIGVATPEDMVTLLGLLHSKTLLDSSSCQAMLEIMKQQFYNDIIPRFLPAAGCAYLDIAHKTGGVEETKVDVGLILSDRVDIAMAIFVDKHPDHFEDIENQASVLAGTVARAVWNHFTGDTGYHDRKIVPGDVDWTRFPGGRWAIYRSPAAPFPHPDRKTGLTKDDGTYYPPFPHYLDSSIVVFVPEGFKETTNGANVIVHFHGHLNDNLGVLERYLMPQAMMKEKINALLILPQGPNRARDEFGGKMEDEGGFKRLVEDVLATMKKEKVVTSTAVNEVIISAHSGGYRPAAFSLNRGDLNDKVTAVFLFDAFYAQQEYFRDWLLGGKGILNGAYTEHLAEKHKTFEAEMKPSVGDRLRFTRTDVEHDMVVQTYFADWLSRLGKEWKF